MPPKNQRGGAAKQKSLDDEREDSLQAVVLADTFETRFEPMSLEKPRCLLPLANTPLIEYTLEFLANAGVEEVFLYGGAHTDQVEKYINASKWRSPSSPFLKFTFLKSTSASVGDVMRDLDGKHLITGDFICVSGDVISNLPIETALAKHRARRQADKNAIMTMVLRQAGNKGRTKDTLAGPIFVVDPTKDRCLHYEEMQSRDGRPFLNIDPELITTHAELDIRHDLVDCSIDICTPEVLGLWSDSFDYQSPRKHFLYGVLKDYELNGKTIHIHVIKEHYAARVRDLKAYNAVSKDVISRYAYPLCPDTNLVAKTSYTFKRGNVYQEDGVVLARSCIIKRKCVIGSETSIGAGSVISNSVIGQRCQIGKNVKIEGAYIFDDAVIGDGAEIHEALIADEAVIGSRTKVQAGALISFRVRIGDGMTITKDMRITRATPEGLTERKSDLSIVGSKGAGYLYEEEDDEDDEEREDVPGLLYNMANLSLSNESISTLNSDVSSEGLARDSRSGSFATSMSDDEGGIDHFHQDAAASIFDGLQTGQTSDVVQLELVGLRMSANASEHQVRKAVIAAFMKRIQVLMESGTGASEAVKQVFTSYKDLIDRIMFDKDGEDKPDQVDFLLLMQQDLVHRNKGDTVLLFSSKELYELEVLEEEAFEQWWADERSTADDALTAVRSQTEQFVEWLANTEEDSSSEEEESEEESDDE